MELFYSREVAKVGGRGEGFAHWALSKAGPGVLGALAVIIHARETN
jgi:hypothetical protein